MAVVIALVIIFSISIMFLVMAFLLDSEEVPKEIENEEFRDKDTREPII